MPCGCGSSTTTPCSIQATVCNGGFVLININNFISSPAHGSVTVVNNKIKYQHDGNSLLPDSFSYINSSGSICTVNITVNDTIDDTQKVIKLVADGECEIGEPIYTWEIPDCAELKPGYTIHDKEIEVIVNEYNPDIPIEEQVCQIKLTVCCGQCSDCCTCKIFYWIPPICTGDCQNEICECLMPCTVYNEVTGNCEFMCEPQGEYCLGSPIINPIVTRYANTNTYRADINIGVNAGSPTKIVFGPPSAVNFSTGIIDESMLTDVTDSEVTIGNIEIKDALTIPDISPSIGHRFYIKELVQHPNNAWYLNQLQDYVFGFYMDTPCGVLKQYMLLKFKDGYNTADASVINTYYIATNNTTNSVFGKILSPQRRCCIAPPEICCPGGYCANCCQDSDCISLVPCDNPKICINGECKCILNGQEVEPLPNGCCPSCTEETIPNCYTCLNGVVVPPTECPPNYTLNYTTCQCECIEGQCYNVITGEVVECVECGNGTIHKCVGGVLEQIPIQCPTCFQCMEGTCIPVNCPPGFIPNPNYNVDSKCCIPECDPNFRASIVCANNQHSLILTDIEGLSGVLTLTIFDSNNLLVYSQTLTCNTATCSFSILLNFPIISSQYRVVLSDIRCNKMLIVVPEVCPPIERFNCISGNCVPDINGLYSSMEQCVNQCTMPSINYTIDCELECLGNCDYRWTITNTSVHTIGELGTILELGLQKLIGVSLSSISEATVTITNNYLGISSTWNGSSCSCAQYSNFDDCLSCILFDNGTLLSGDSYTVDIHLPNCENITDLILSAGFECDSGVSEECNPNATYNVCQVQSSDCTTACNLSITDIDLTCTNGNVTNVIVFWEGPTSVSGNVVANGFNYNISNTSNNPINIPLNIPLLPPINVIATLNSGNCTDSLNVVIACPTFLYSCLNGECIQTTGGTMTLSECTSNCQATPTGYNCEDCSRLVAFGQYATQAECQSTCPNDAELSCYLECINCHNECTENVVFTVCNTSTTPVQGMYVELIWNINAPSSAIPYFAPITINDTYTIQLVENSGNFVITSNCPNCPQVNLVTPTNAQIVAAFNDMLSCVANEFILATDECITFKSKPPYLPGYSFYGYKVTYAGVECMKYENCGSWSDCIVPLCDVNITGGNISNDGIIELPSRYIYQPKNIDNGIGHLSNVLSSTSKFGKNIEEAQKQLTSKPNVVSTGFGKKYKNGIATGEIGIIAYVKEKKNVSPKDMIPKVINNIVTDVQVVEEYFPIDYCNMICNPNGSTSPDNNCSLTHRSRQYYNGVRPYLVGGLSAISFTSSSINPCGGCTYGIAALDSNDDLIGLANTHCLTTTYGYNSSTLNTNYIYPSPMDINCPSNTVINNNNVGTVITANLPTSNTLQVDAGIIKFSPPASQTDVSIMPGIHQLLDGPFNWFPGDWDIIQDTINHGYNVFKSGRSTGTIDLTNTNFSIDSFMETALVGGVTVRKVFKVNHSCAESFSTGGDSGSPILIKYLTTNGDWEYLFLGLLFGGNSTSALIIPSYRLEEILDVKRWDGKIVVESNDLYITVCGREYERVEPTTKPITHIKD